MRCPMSLLSLFVFVLGPMSTVQAAPQHFQSGESQVQLIELYTSEGCSSCPPADKRLSKLKHDASLWRERIPLAFHVDYWDYIGWQDPFARSENSRRQRNHAAAGRFSSVYTPGFLIDGQEWRGFFRGAELPKLRSGKPGPLSLDYDNGHVVVRYMPTDENTQGLRLQLAWLGAGIESSVSSGENSGLKLEHDFVVLRQQEHMMPPQQSYVHSGIFSAKGLAQARRYALVAWLEQTATGRPVQAVGGWVLP